MSQRAVKKIKMSQNQAKGKLGASEGGKNTRPKKPYRGNRKQRVTGTGNLKKGNNRPPRGAWYNVTGG